MGRGVSFTGDSCKQEVHGFFNPALPLTTWIFWFLLGVNSVDHLFLRLLEGVWLIPPVIQRMRTSYISVLEEREFTKPWAALSLWVSLVKMWWGRLHSTPSVLSGAYMLVGRGDFLLSELSKDKTLASVFLYVQVKRKMLLLTYKLEEQQVWINPDSHNKC